MGQSGEGSWKKLEIMGQREKDRTGGCCPACAVFLSDVYELVKRLLFFFTELFVYGLCVIIRRIFLYDVIDLPDPGYRFL